MASQIDRKQQKNISGDGSQRTMQKIGGVASFLLAISFIVAPWFYLTGNLGEPLGPFNYALADLLAGPVWAASLVTMVYALREHFGAQAQRRMRFALLAAVLAAGLMVATASIRANNRQYHLLHPELHLESVSSVMVAWTTLVAGLSGAGWHFLGWSFALVGWSGWTTRRLPSLLSELYVIAGAAALFVYALPVNEGFVVLLGLVISIWQGIVLWLGVPVRKRSSA